MLVRVFYQTWPWEAVGRVIETGQYRAGRYRTVPPEPGALMPASNSSSMQAPLERRAGREPYGYTLSKSKGTSSTLT